MQCTSVLCLKSFAAKLFDARVNPAESVREVFLFLYLEIFDGYGVSRSLLIGAWRRLRTEGEVPTLTAHVGLGYKAIPAAMADAMGRFRGPAPRGIGPCRAAIGGPHAQDKPLI